MTAVAGLAAALSAWLALPPTVTPESRLGPHRVRRVSVLLVVGTGVAVALPRPWVGPALALALGAVGGWSLWRAGVRARRAERTASMTAQVCDVLADELAAGRPTESALAEATDPWPEVRVVAEVCRLGGDVPTALRRAAVLPGAGGLGLLAAAWLVSGRTGGGLAAATRRVADTVRREQATRRLVVGELASARATARLVAALPLVALVMGSGAGGDPWGFLVGTPFGLSCLAGGLATGLGGLWWIEAIAREVDR